MLVTMIAIIGAGTMGSGIAQVAATSGFEVTMIDVTPESLAHGQAAIARSVDKLHSKGQLTDQQRAAAAEIVASTRTETVNRNRSRALSPLV
jgi:3-hydroxybutyryl-CoA dehydrogenase